MSFVFTESKSLKAKNNKYSYGTLRLRTRFQDANYISCSVSLWSLVSETIRKISIKDSDA